MVKSKSLPPCAQNNPAPIDLKSSLSGCPHTADFLMTSLDEVPESGSRHGAVDSHERQPKRTRTPVIGKGQHTRQGSPEDGTFSNDE